MKQIGNRTSPRPSTRPPAPGGFARGFTLTEVLVVIAVMVLLLGVSVPVFKALTGNRSVDAAQNVIAAALGDARAEAIALGRVTGVFFYEDRVTRRVAAALVRSTGETTPPSGTAVFHALDLIPDREPFLLPTGVGVQVLDNCEVQGGLRLDDGYIGLNDASVNGDYGNLRYGGVILFDPRGQLVSVPYGFNYQIQVGTNPEYSDMGALFYGVSQRNSQPTFPCFVPPRNNTTTPPQSQFGLVLYDAEEFRGASPGTNSLDDPQMSGQSYAGAEQAEETWLDNYAMPYLVNRYSGALIRGE